MLTFEVDLDRCEWMSDGDWGFLQLVSRSNGKHWLIKHMWEHIREYDSNFGYNGLEVKEKHHMCNEFHVYLKFENIKEFNRLKLKAPELIQILRLKEVS